MRTLLLFVVSWGIGLSVYLGSLVLLHQQTIGLADLRAVVIWSLGAFALCFALFYLPALFALRRILRGVRPVWAFPLLAIALGFVPTGLIFLIWGGGLHALLSSEATLFHCMFAGVGLVIGFGFARIYRKDFH